MESVKIIIKNYPYIATFIMFLVGFYIIITDKNLIKKAIGLGVIQSGVILFYILIAKIKNAVPPIYNPNIAEEVYSNPLPHVLMLTAIVVSIATTSLACALIYKIYKDYGTIDESEIIKINKQENNHDSY